MYFIMHKDFAQPMLDKYPDAARYGDGDYILTGEMPEGFSGQVVDLRDKKFTDKQLTDRVNLLRTEKPTGRVLALNGEQGDYLYRNHPDFMPSDEE